jgi:hypothetical protein
MIFLIAGCNFLDSFRSAWWTTKTGKRRLEKHGKGIDCKGKQ